MVLDDFPEDAPNIVILSSKKNVRSTDTFLIMMSRELETSKLFLSRENLLASLFSGRFELPGQAIGLCRPPIRGGYLHRGCISSVEASCTSLRTFRISVSRDSLDPTVN